MKKSRFLLSFLLLAIAAGPQAKAGPVATVALAQFTPGSSWSWTYSSLDTATGAWTPYLVETYVLTETQGKTLTFEMHSSPLPAHATTAHHKFVLDFTDCERAAAGGPRGWRMRFYTHSFGPDWSLVSNAYENTAFTEKFNCVTPTEKETVRYAKLNWRGAETDIFAPAQSSRSGASFYFLAEPELGGVAAYKEFAPAKNYKFEFTGKAPSGS